MNENDSFKKFEQNKTYLLQQLAVNKQQGLKKIR